MNNLEATRHSLIGKLVRANFFSFPVNKHKLVISSHVPFETSFLLFSSCFVVLEVEEIPEGAPRKSTHPGAFMLKVLTVPEGIIGWLYCCDPAWLVEITEEKP